MNFATLRNFAKITGCEYSKSHAIFRVLLSLTSKIATIMGAKII